MDVCLGLLELSSLTHETYVNGNSSAHRGGDSNATCNGTRTRVAPLQCTLPSSGVEGGGGGSGRSVAQFFHLWVDDKIRLQRSTFGQHRKQHEQPTSVPLSIKST